jgi:AraC-like DNA-binding protein
MYPFFQALEETHVLSCSQLRQSGIHHFRLLDASSVLPRPVVDDIVARVIHSQGREFIAEVAKNYRMSTLPGYGDFVMSRPDVLSGMLAVAKPEARLLSGQLISVAIQKKDVVYSVFLPSVGAGELNWPRIFALALTLSTFRVPFGESWAPKRIDVPSEDMSFVEEFSDLGDIDLRTSRSMVRFHFDTVLLGRRLPGVGNLPTATYLPLSNSLSIFQILDSFGPESYPSIAMIASYLDMSSRTLERMLAAEGTTFQDLLTTWRIGLAFKLLHDPNMLVRDISARLHYSSTSHFDRAFRGWTGTTPGIFRDE